MRNLRRTAIAILLVVLVICIAFFGWHRLDQRRQAGVADGSSSAPTATGTDALAGGFERSRREMLKSQIEGRGVKDKEVLRAMAAVPRHEFVLPEYVDQAYADHPLPIGYGQTISQPYIVAVMTELLQLRTDSRVLEVGTGSGFQAAILAEIVGQVYSVEIVDELCQRATRDLARLGYTNVEVKCGDGYYGWEEHAPYDAIIVTCAPDHIPQPLVAQLADGGRMVVPVGPPGAYQALWLVERHGDDTSSRRVMGVAFVPLTGGH